MENLKTYFKKSLPYLLATISFVVISYIYFSPLLIGKDLSQMDQNHAKGMAKEIMDFKAQTGEDTQWTNSMFGGMPTYQIASTVSYNIYLHIQRFLQLNLPYTTVAILFILLFGFYLLMLSLGFNSLQSALGAIAFAFASYNIIIIMAGHITKVYAIAYMPPVIAGVIMTYKKKYLLGGIITTFALGIEIATNHIQVIYYLGLMVVLLVIVKFIYAILEKEIKSFGIATAILVASAILALLPNITNLATTYEYGKESIRGPSELTDNMANKSSGLDKDYALSWSYGVDETLTLLIPNAKGGASAPIGANQNALKDVAPDYVKYVAQSSQYWGDQPFTSGPVYMGAILMFLFVLGLFIVEGYIKWWLLAAAILGIFLSWGRNFMTFTDIFFYYVPLYNKFRTVSMSLVITGFTVPMLAMMTIKKIIDQPDILKKKQTWFYVSLGITAGLSIILYFIPESYGSFLSPQEIKNYNPANAENPQMAQQVTLFTNSLKSARISIFKADAIRSFSFIIISAGLLWFYSTTKKIKTQYLIIGLAILFLADMWTVDKRYLNESHFKKKRIVRNEFKKTPADEIILKDKDPNYRVLSLLRSPFNDGYTPYFHKSIGGYHGAKLRRYQEVIERHLNREIQTVAYAAQNDTTGSIGNVLSKLNVMNMLNTKYIIFTPEISELNWSSLGHAWFVDDYEIVNNADEEITALGSFNPKKTAIIDKRFENIISKLPKSEYFSLDTGFILLESYKPNHLTYKSATRKERLAVFSEIYYDKGWNAYIDDFPVEYIRANYILRAMIIPKGKHKIEFKFEPKTYNVSQTIALSSSIIILLMFLGLIGYNFYKKPKIELKEEKEA